MLSCTYDMLDMFRALLCPSSGALDCMCVIAACGVQCLVAGCQGSGAGQQGVRPGRGMLHKVAGVMHPRCCRWPATSRVHYTTSCDTQSSAPEDGQNNCPKHAELTGIINKPLLLHLFGCLYYLYQWCTVKQISDNEIYLLIKYIKSVLWRVAKSLSYIGDARFLKVKHVRP